ncbi:hypothetical protein J6590_071888 [Homalodisca vitripennis]|nr:hypothetical protein J6590_071888 [Homalodisca vitripennis]
MSEKGKKSGKKSGSHKGFNRDVGDVTLADYANSSVLPGRGRLRKSKASLSVVCEVKQLNIQDKAWDEKLDEFEGDFDFVKEGNEDGEEVFVMKKASCRRKKTLSESIAGCSTDGNTYPLDIWHILSKYIRPEDIATFSAICRNSWSVVQTPTFWLSLYKRYYKNVPNLPSRLQPACMVRHHGLKACVIRSLFYMYPPLAARIDRASMSAPYHLKSRQCISMWQESIKGTGPYKRERSPESIMVGSESGCGIAFSNSKALRGSQPNKWKLSFKLRRKDFQPCQSKGGKPNLMEILGDIFANADEGCTLLQVVSAERMVLPVVMGLTVHNINMSLDMNGYK